MSILMEGMCPLIQVFDMPTAIRFYRDVLGFELVNSAPPGDDCDWCLLKFNDIWLMLNTQYEKDDRPQSPSPARVGAHGDTALYFRVSDLNAAYESLKSRGVNADPPLVTGYGMTQVYFKDPDGYSLCFQWPTESAKS